MVNAELTSRKEFEISEEDLQKLLDASKPVPWFAPGGVWPKTPEENANAAWRALGKKLGFVWDTVRPIEGKGQRFFTAVPVETEKERFIRMATEELDKFTGLPSTNGELSLFTTAPNPVARTSDPETSHEAAASMIDGAETQRRAIVFHLWHLGPRTADELDEELELRPTSAGRRLPELRTVGLARPTDGKRKTRSGRMARVWEAVR